MSKSLQSEHGDTSSQSGDKSVAFNAHGWEAFVGPCLGQTQHGRFAHREPQASTEFSDPRDETPNVRMQDGEFFVTDGVRFSAAQSSLSTLPGAGARAGVFACPSQQRQLLQKTIHPRPGRKSVAAARGSAGCDSAENFCERATSDSAGNGDAS